jgi:hypothetical protein
MRYVEIEPRNGSHYIVIDGQEWSRHNDVKIAEKVRDQLLAEEIQRAQCVSMDRQWEVKLRAMDHAEEMER